MSQDDFIAAAVFAVATVAAIMMIGWSAVPAVLGCVAIATLGPS